MLKSTVIEPEKIEEKPLEFPLLARWRPNGMVILFTEDRRGTVIKGCYNKSLGHVSCGWAPLSDSWEILPKGYAVKIEVE